MKFENKTRGMNILLDEDDFRELLNSKEVFSVNKGHHVKVSLTTQPSYIDSRVENLEAQIAGLKEKITDLESQIKKWKKRYNTLKDKQKKTY